MKKQYPILLMIITAIVLANLVVFMTPKVTLGANVVCTNLSGNLKVGSRDRAGNIDVSLLQNFLNSQGYMKIAATGYFGKVTQDAVINFQTREGLPATGLVMTTRLK
jgi:peptidoglycan hydrolase-like protein with peptidoglycan-binding domain